MKVRGRGLNFEAAAAILKPSCSQATGPWKARTGLKLTPAGLMRSDQTGGREQLKLTPAGLMRSDQTGGRKQLKLTPAGLMRSDQTGGREHLKSTL